VAPEAVGAEASQCLVLARCQQGLRTAQQLAEASRTEAPELGATASHEPKPPAGEKPRSAGATGRGTRKVRPPAAPSVTQQLQETRRAAVKLHTTSGVAAILNTTMTHRHPDHAVSPLESEPSHRQAM
jgi:hypothetical protein